MNNCNHVCFLPSDFCLGRSVIYQLISWNILESMVSRLLWHMPEKIDISCINLTISPTNLNAFMNTLCASQGSMADERAISCTNAEITMKKISILTVVRRNFYIHNYENLLTPSFFTCMCVWYNQKGNIYVHIYILIWKPCIWIGLYIPECRMNLFKWGSIMILSS